MEKETFIKVKSSKEKKWINDIYYGIKGLCEHGHIVASGSLIIKGAIIPGKTINNFECEDILYHKNAQKKVLLDTKIKR